MVNTMKYLLDNIIISTLLLLCMLVSGCIFVDDKCQYETICGNDRVCQTRCMSGYPYSCNEVCWLEYVCREEYICYNK